VSRSVSRRALTTVTLHGECFIHCSFCMQAAECRLIAIFLLEPNNSHLVTGGSNCTKRLVHFFVVTILRPDWQWRNSSFDIDYLCLGIVTCASRRSFLSSHSAVEPIRSSLAQKCYKHGQLEDNALNRWKVLFLLLP
jgi:hypothetical protein